MDAPKTSEVRQKFLPRAAHAREVDIGDENILRRLWRMWQRRRSRKAEALINGTLTSEASSSKGTIGIIIGLVLFSLAYYFTKAGAYDIKVVNSEAPTYVCINGTTCARASSGTSKLGLNACLMTCGAPSVVLFPKPTKAKFSAKLLNFLPADLIVLDENDLNVEHFRLLILESLYALHPKRSRLDSSENPFPSRFTSAKVMVKIKENGKDGRSDFFRVRIRPEKKRRGLIRADIEAASRFGLISAIETFVQMVTFDAVTETLQTFQDALIEDAPYLKHRGLLIDSSWDLVTAEDVEALVEAAAAIRFNSFHWFVNRETLNMIGSNRLKQLGAFSAEKGVVLMPQVASDECKFHDFEDVLKSFKSSEMIFVPWKASCFESRETLEALRSLRRAIKVGAEMNLNKIDALRTAEAEFDVIAIRGRSELVDSLAPFVNVSKLVLIDEAGASTTCDEDDIVDASLPESVFGGIIELPRRDFVGVFGGRWTPSMMRKAASLWTKDDASNPKSIEFHLRRMRSRGFAVSGLTPDLCLTNESFCKLE